MNNLEKWKPFHNPKERIRDFRGSFFPSRVKAKIKGAKKVLVNIASYDNKEKLAQMLLPKSLVPLAEKRERGPATGVSKKDL